MFKIGHRGACAYEPENTISSFRKALELGANMVELDVRLSKDGVIMVSHDSNISKYTNGSGFIENMLFRDIQKYDIKDKSGEKIPTLKEVLDDLQGRGGVYIEIKGDYLEDKLVYLLKEINFVEQIIIGSFDFKKIKKIKQINPLLKTSLLVGTPYTDFVKQVLEIEANYVHLCWRNYENPHMLVQQKLVEELRKKKLGIIVWNEERPDIITELQKKDLDGICSNKPEML